MLAHVHNCKGDYQAAVRYSDQAFQGVFYCLVPASNMNILYPWVVETELDTCSGVRLARRACVRTAAAMEG